MCFEDFDPNSKKDMRGGMVVIFVVVLAFALISPCVGRTRVEVQTSNGLVRGTVSLSRLRREFYSWRGIPYAEPPVGKLRFKDPLPIGSWNETLNAIAYGPSCVQTAIGPWPFGKEDCLKLNVFTPANEFDLQRPLPVMIFIHGGLFATLSAKSFAPDYFMDEDVVIVTINYRLEVFGFLSTGDGVIRGNMGLKDQSMAIKWVRNNIDAFGGDRSRITIFGQSAGAASVHFQMLSPMSRGLFDAAIAQSGTAFAPWALNETPVGQARKFAKHLGCPTKSSDELLDCLQARSVGEIGALRFRAHIFLATDLTPKQDLFLPVIEAINDENAFLAEHPNKIMEEGKSANVPWLTGVNSAEGLLFAGPFIFNPRFRKQLYENWNEFAPDLLYGGTPTTHNGKRKIYSKIREFYFGPRNNLTSDSALADYIKMMADRHFVIPFVKAINEHRKVAQVFGYHFSKNGPSPYEPLTRVDSSYPRLIGLARAEFQTWIDSVRNNTKPKSGAGHYDEMHMLTPTPSLYYVGQHHRDFEFSRDLVKLWVSFASGNKPLSFRALEFSPLQSSGNIELFQLDEKPQRVSWETEERMNLWNELEAITLLKAELHLEPQSLGQIK